MALVDFVLHQILRILTIDVGKILIANNYIWRTKPKPSEGILVPKKYKNIRSIDAKESIRNRIYVHFVIFPLNVYV